MSSSDERLSHAEETRLVLEIVPAIYVAQMQRTSTANLGLALRLAATAVGAAQSERLRDIIEKAKNTPHEALTELTRHEVQFGHRVSVDTKEKLAAFAALLSGHEQPD